ncbi:type II secretion system F family protein [Aquipuribacter nitratireducens]|uniref:Type II secretion system F family protein n=1 Tax=Aquipuribacter nitratireducens TaxID=650104 RepID=A0ABW0GQI0_9MICO
MAAATKTYEYSVRDRAGKLTSGKLEAANEAVLVSKLKQMGYAPVSVREAGGGMNREITLPFGNSVKLKDLAVMNRQFATMINSGLSLLRALTILAEQTENKTLAKTLSEVRADVETGQSLSTALAKHVKVFPPLMVNMCRAGEVGGFLDAVLLQIAENYEAEVKLRNKVKSAMTYPVVVFVIAILAVVGMLLFIVPVFVTMFDGLGGELPAPTKVLVFLAAAMKIVAPVGAVAIVVGTVVWQRIKHQERVRLVVDPLILKIPIFGGLAQKIAISRFSRNLGTMISSGVPILQALDIVADTTGNIVLTKAVREVQVSVRQGESLAGPLANHPVFPPMVVQMLAVGEDTGAMDQMLHKISEFYDQEVEATTEALTSLIEPLMIAVLGSIIGAMIVALYMPIFSVFDLIE